MVNRIRAALVAGVLAGWLMFPPIVPGQPAGIPPGTPIPLPGAGARQNANRDIHVQQHALRREIDRVPETAPVVPDRRSLVAPLDFGPAPGMSPFQPAPDRAGQMAGGGASLGVTMVPNDFGIQIATVAPGSPAEQAGLQPGDYIHTFNNQRFSTPWQLSKAIGQLAAGERVTIEITRQGRLLSVGAVLGEGTLAQPAVGQPAAIGVARSAAAQALQEGTVPLAGAVPPSFPLRGSVARDRSTESIRAPSLGVRPAVDNRILLQQVLDRLDRLQREVAGLREQVSALESQRP